jgi:hypothetical protein
MAPNPYIGTSLSESKGRTIFETSYKASSYCDFPFFGM